MASDQRRLRVYLVEDSPRLLRRLKEALEEIGTQVVGHSGSATAAACDIDELCPDVAVVDIGLQRGNGFDVLRALKLRSGGRNPIAIVLTNYSSSPYRTAAKRFGASYFFDKSTEIMTMLATVATIAHQLGLAMLKPT